MDACKYTWNIILYNNPRETSVSVFYVCRMNSSSLSTDEFNAYVGCRCLAMAVSSGLHVTICQFYATSAVVFDCVGDANCG
jgi:hypothetical protein